MMTKPSYPAFFHNIHRALRDVDYPITKEALLELVKDREVRVDWDVTVPLSTMIEPIPQTSFSCAADFYCRYIASLGK
ncbi:MAG: hypothetical protein ACOX36_08690 [Saccharofermentanales bacterium]|jgi:hypothetical protein|nr:hypothetical protein [Clostridiaceae bacterium]NMA18872.1 hypothetical protein [Clostridiaceae bacterium]